MEKVYVVFRNADFTEGRGPMLLHRVFSNGPAAVKYVEGKSGIYGSPQRVEMGKYGHYAYANGYLIDEVQVHGTVEDVLEAERQAAVAAALKKLTKQEIELLGLNKEK